MCEGCSSCRVRVRGVVAAEDGRAPVRGPSGQLLHAFVRLDQVEAAATRGELCRLERVRRPSERPEGPHVEFLAPRVGFELELRGFRADEIDRLRLALPGWSEPFVADAYGLEVYDRVRGRETRLCRSIHPSPTVGGLLPTHVESAAPSGSADRRPVPAGPLGRLGHAPAPARPFDPGRHRTRLEIRQISGRAMVLDVVRPQVLNLDRSALEEAGPGHGWDLWDPEGWSNARCRRFRSAQCLMWLYADALDGAERLIVRDASGRRACGRGCAVRLLEVRPEPGPEVIRADDVVTDMIAAVGVGGDARTVCASTTATVSADASRLELAAVPVRVTLEVLFEAPLERPRELWLRQPGLEGDGNWFAGVDLGASLLDAEGHRFGRARRLCVGGVLRPVVTASVATP
jgi:hypothetical protein